MLYGRERETSKLLNLLIAERIVLLYSPSGAGKTSLVQAALIPQLEAEGFAVLPVIRVSVEPPLATAADRRPPATDGNTQHATRNTQQGQPTTDNGQRKGVLHTLPVDHGHPVNRYILSALLSLEEGLPADRQLPVERLVQMTLADYLHHREDDLEGSDGTVLVFDQFEEILTNDPADRATKEAFFAQVGAALRDRQRWALFSMREDYLAPLDPYLRPIPTRLGNTFRLDLLDEKAARMAMQQPARAAGITFTDAAATALADDLRKVRVQGSDSTTREQHGLYVEPVQLQVVCYRLWEQLPLDDLEIGVEDVAAVGDVDQALTAYYADRVAVIAAKAGVPERAIREWFDHQLITDQGIRGQVLRGAEASGGLPNQAINPLINAHLVRREERRGATWFELAHDRLIEPVHRDNIAWLEAHLGPLQRQAALWRQQSRPEGLLLRDRKLVEAEAWAAANPGELTAVEHDFLDACRNLREIIARARRTNRIIRILAMAASLVSIIAIFLFVLALNARQDAVDKARLAAEAQEKAQDEATRARAAEDDAKQQKQLALVRQLASQSLESREQRPQRALLLALESLKAMNQAGDRVLEAESALRQALGTIGGVPFGSHTSEIDALAFSNDGRSVASSGGDGIIRLWNVDRPGAAPLELNGGYFQKLAFSPDGRYLVGSSGDGSLLLWKVAQPVIESVQLVKVQMTAETGAYVFTPSLAFSPDGRYLAANNQTSPMLWDLADLAPKPILLPGEQSLVAALAFSPDGRYLVTASDAVRLWDLANLAAEPVILPDPNVPVEVLAFSPDGRHLAIGGDGTMWLWSQDTPDAEPAELPGSSGPLSALAFSPDGRYLAADGDDNTILLWDLNDQTAKPTVLRGHTDFIAALAFMPNSPYLVSGSADGTLRRWDTADPALSSTTLYGHDGPVTSLSISPDGRHLVSGGADGTLRLWAMTDLDQNQTDASRVLLGYAGGVATVQFTPDRQGLIVSGNDGPVQVWDLEGAVPVQPYEIPGTIALDSTGKLLLSKELRYLIAQDDTGTLRRWNLAEFTADPSLIPSNTDLPQVIASSADLRYLLVSAEGVLRRWDMTDPAAEVTLGQVSPETNSPDGRYIIIADENQQDQVWDLEGAATLIDTLPASTQVLDLNRRYLLTLDSDDGVQLRDLANPTAGPVPLQGLSRGLSLRFSPDERYLIGDNSGNNQDSRAWRWDLTDLAAEPAVLRGFNASAGVQEFTPNGRYLITAGDNGTLQRWDLTNPAAGPVELRGYDNTLADREINPRMQSSPDGRYILVDALDNTLRLWDTDNPRAPAVDLRGHDDWISEVAFSPDGTLLATASNDDTTRLWDLTDLSADPLVLRGHKGDVVSVAFSPDGTYLVTGSNDGTARLWHMKVDQLTEVACTTVGRNLSWAEWQQTFDDTPYDKTCPHLPIHPSFIEAGRDLARRGDQESWDQAITLFRRAQELEPGLKLDPEAEVRRAFAPILLAQGENLAYQGKIDEARAAYAQAQEYDPDLEIDALSWYTLCWNGSVWGRVAAVLDDCERAVATSPPDQLGSFQSARGMARALTGDRKGAIEDLKAHLAWSEAQLLGAEYVDQVRSWIASLEAGGQPFDEATLRGLRGE